MFNRPAPFATTTRRWRSSSTPDMIAATTVTRSPQVLRDFVHEYGDAIFKPLDGMGGSGIFMSATATRTCR